MRASGIALPVGVALAVLATGCGDPTQGALSDGNVAPDGSAEDAQIGNAGDAGDLFNLADLADASASCAPFTHLPLAIDPDPARSDLRFLVPLGNLNPPGHVFPTDHLYLAGRLADPNDPNSPMIDVPVVAPGDAVVTGIFTVEHHFTGPNPPPDHTDYSLFFQSCPALSFYLQHLGALSPDLSKETARTADHCDSYTAGEDNVRRCDWYVSHAVAGGALVGRASMIHEWIDFGAYDARMPSLAYANPARDSSSMNGIDLLHVACPLDYYGASMLDAIRPFIGLEELRRTVPPVCGLVNQDVAGTAQGRWYAFPTPMNPDDNFPEDPHLALVHDSIDPLLAALSIGTSIPSLAGSVLTFVPAQSPAADVNPDFAAVRPGMSACFDHFGGAYGDPLGQASPVVVIKVTSATELSISAVAGAKDCESIRDQAGHFPMPEAVTFYR